jgi:chromosome segregation ATPase
MEKQFQEALESAKEQMRAEWRQDLTGLEEVLATSFQDLQSLFENFQSDRESDHETEKVAWHRRMVGIELELTGVQKHLQALSEDVRELNAALSRFNSR